MVALAVFAVLVLAISSYQLRVQLYRQAAWQLYSATNICENMIEEWWTGKSLPMNQTIINAPFEIKTTITPGPNQAFKFVQIRVSWISVLKQSQTIKFDVICL